MKINKKADFELDQLGKLILAGIVLLILIYIVGWYVSPRLENSENMIVDLFRGF